MDSQQTINSLIQFMLDRKAPHAASSLIHGISVVIELIRRGTMADEEDDAPPPAEIAEALGSNLPPPPPKIQRDPMDISEIVVAFIDHVQAFKNALEQPLTAQEELESTMGKQKPLGIERLSICELFADLLRGNNVLIFKKMEEAKVMELIMKLFFDFPWNNLLHMVACDMVNAILEAGDAAEAENLIISVCLYTRSISMTPL
jgi:hypothetical protein